MRAWLRVKRQAKNMTMAEVAEKLGITESYYSMIESGDRQKKMDVALASKLSVILDIPLKRIAELENQ